MLVGGKTIVVKLQMISGSARHLVAFTEEGRLVGDGAKNQCSAINPKIQYTILKRLIGRKYDDLPSNGKINYLIALKIYVTINRLSVSRLKDIYSIHPEENISMILSKMKGMLKLILDIKLKTVVTVPVSLMIHKDVLPKTGQISGLNVLRIITCPTAAATRMDWIIVKHKQS